MADQEISGGKEVKVEDDGVEIKAKKITDKDFKKIETSLKMELAKRKDADYRQNHENKWKVVDRQVILNPMDTSNNSEETWLATFELGELAKASEIMTADVLRVIFPEMRSWFEAHVEIDAEIDPKTGDKEIPDKKFQDQVDGRLRSMMSQQHTDFGLRDRVELSLKEALHHGSFVAELIEDSMDMYVNGTDVKEISAPTWKPHSMWNCWPDPSPSLVGTNMFYTGSMFIQSFMPRHKFLEQAVGEGWIPKALKKIPKEENDQKDVRTKDVKIVTYYGEVVIPKSLDGIETSGEDMFFPNMKAILANGKLVYLNHLSTPYLPVIYKGYEKMDVRDPYFISPIIKQSPMQKIVSILANEFVNGTMLHTRPPIVYDGNDPDFVINGGPLIAPGAKTSTKGSANYKLLETGDPRATLTGLEFCLGTMKESLGRPGVPVGDRATKAEVVTKQADSESGPFGFAVKMDEALRTFLYMQHAMNLSKKGFKYSYYNPELDSADFLRATYDDLPKTVHFEVVGSKGVLGEERRHQAFVQSTAFLSGNPLFAPLLEPEEITKQVYMDGGMKNPERFLKTGDIPPDLKAKMDGMMGVIQKLGAELKDEKAQTNLQMMKIKAQHDAKMQQIKADQEAKVVELASKHHESDKNVANLTAAHQAHIEKIIMEFEHKMELLLALEQKDKEGKDKLNEKDKANESNLTEQLISIQKEVKDAVQGLAALVKKPRKLVRDASGKAVSSTIGD